MVKENGKILPFTNDYSGYMGIAPYTADPDNKERNFLWQLKNQNLIENLTIAFFVHLKDDFRKLPSTIKFGSYDPENIKPGENLRLIETIDKTTWDIQAVEFKVSEQDGIT